MTPSLLKLGLSALVFCAFVQLPANAFNYSPQPNIVIEAPQNLKTFLPQVRSSYFGYAMVIRSTDIFVGAPRAQSTLESQRHVNETGAIYRCQIKERTCAPYIIDKYGNRQIEFNDYTYDSEKRDHQWLGGSMDGGVKDTDKLLICAPRFMTPLESDYLMNGICYFVNDTLTPQPLTVAKISPLRLASNQVYQENGERYYKYMLAEMGLSAHVTANNEEIVVGAPGLHTWKGSAIHHRKILKVEDPSLSRRDLDAVRIPRQSGPEPQYFYKNIVLRPELWDQQSDSYFGFAMGSGYFDSNDRKRLMYVATAPQANLQSGEAYLYDLPTDQAVEINKKYVFRGQDFGEYFGYALATEDLNGDGLTDVVISAPQFSKTGYFENGAIYIFVNQGNFNFERKRIISPSPMSARFGTTLSNLGDINHDGYNDIAVGAPFQDDGVVYIYLGNQYGLREKYSQQLNASTTVFSQYGSQMFGHGLSKGSDIDGNGFNDFAVGAPNAEAIFVYRAYPVVKILTNMHSPTREIKPDQTTFKLMLDYAISTTSKRVKNQPITMTIVADPRGKRVKFQQTRTNELTFNVSAGAQQQSQAFDCQVQFKVEEIFQPIEMQLSYNILNGVPDSEVFCETCVAVDPEDEKTNSLKIIFSTGCKSEICVADLQVTSPHLSKSYVLGSSRTLTVVYEVVNSGETAYLPQINITSSNRMPFARVPSNCRNFNADYMLCDLNRGQAMTKGSKDKLEVIFDTAGISGKAMIITAKVFSTGAEANPANNVITDVITLNEFTEVDVVGTPITPSISLEKTKNITEITNNYEIKSVGPSTVNAMEVVFNIPIAYRISGSQAVVKIIDSSDIFMRAVSDGQLIGIDLFEGDKQILMNTHEYSTSTSSSSGSSSGSGFSANYSSSATYSSHSNSSYTRISANGMHYDSAKMGMFEEQPDYGLSDSVISASLVSRRTRRQVAAQTATKDQYARIAKAHELLGEELKSSLPVNRTIVFNCHFNDTTICARAVLHVYNFKPDKPIVVTMKYKIDLKEVDQILIEPWEFFVVLIDANVKRMGDATGQTMAVRSHIEYNIISKYQLYKTPYWIIILAVLGGLLLLGLLSYGMYKAGFFKRTTRDEMEKQAHHRTGSGADMEPETENLNTESN